ncbi:predicted protein [Uncinocarpus reesii 1704]|uniref:Uncharacterized protein n=1 Tax=Uncinocarpus reesii (strain UAMH 1704) TaxID=336963 RepID=C4JTA3_UNCRE|nr:uncharacterized protein UREG_05692 [Uncinocarpus reesii 1704]EEP80850.1 predicted protein [Uncinocarpus reesii 1704]
MAPGNLSIDDNCVAFELLTERLYSFSPMLAAQIVIETWQGNGDMEQVIK